MGSTEFSRFERAYLVKLLESEEGNITGAAQRAAIAWRNLYAKLVAHGLVTTARELRTPSSRPKPSAKKKKRPIARRLR